MARQYLEDSFGPDGIRVTVAVEPAGDRARRAREAWVAPMPAAPKMWPRRLRRQQPEDDRWVVVVESDSGQTARLIRGDREEAWLTAETVAAVVRERGVDAISTLR